MSILRRMRDITVASLNERLEQAEDPVRLIDQYLASQREQIRESEKLHMQCLTHAQSMRNQYLTALETKEKRERQALLALKAGEDDIARIALQEKIQQEEKSEQYRALYEQSQQSILELADQIGQLKADYDEIAAKRSYYQARLESVRLQRQMNERLGASGATAAPRAFRRLEEQVSDMEWEARSLRDVRRATQEALYSAGSAVQSALENELARLKKSLEKEGWSGK